MKKALVIFGGGGLKGIAHIGVLKALKRLKINVAAYAGTSVGSIIAAGAAGDLPLEEIIKFGKSIRARDILDFNFSGLVTQFFRLSALNRGDRLHNYIKQIIPFTSFSELKTPLYINAVNLALGTNVIFGLPSLDKYSLTDVITASCSIPGIFPPRKIDNQYYVDGSVIDNLQLRLAKILDVDLIIAVNLREITAISNKELESFGFLSVINRTNDLTGQFISESNFSKFEGIPKILIHPDVAFHDYFDFQNLSKLIDIGEMAAEKAFERYFRELSYPEEQKKPIGNPFIIDKTKCSRCGLCVINNADQLFETKKLGEEVIVNRFKKNTHDLAPLKECPKGAIKIDHNLFKILYGSTFSPEQLEILRKSDKLVESTYESVSYDTRYLSPDQIAQPIEEKNEDTLPEKRYEDLYDNEKN